MIHFFKNKIMSTILLCTIVTLGTAQVQIGQDILGESAGFETGTAIDMSRDGEVIAVADYSVPSQKLARIRVYNNILSHTNTNGNWLQLGNDILPDGVNIFGIKIALSADGNRLAVAYTKINPDRNSVKIYELQNDQWTQLGETLLSGNVGGIVYSSIDLSDDGSVIAIGSAYQGHDSGVVHTFNYRNNHWSQMPTIVPPLPASTSVINGFGKSVSLSADGNRIAVGEVHYDIPTDQIRDKDEGRVTVFAYNHLDAWDVLGTPILGESNIGLGVGLGESISLSADGNIVAAGTTQSDYNGLTNSGHVETYKFDGTIWVPFGGKIIGQEGSNLGGSISLSSDGQTLAVSNQNYHEQPGQNIGQWLVYQYKTPWQLAYSKSGTALHDLYGKYVSLGEIHHPDGTIDMRVTIAAPHDDTNGNDAGKVQVFKLAQAALAVDQFDTLKASIYPNPVKDNLSIDFGETIQQVSISIHNALGQLVLKQEFNHTHKTHLSVEQLSKGIYFLDIKTDNHTRKNMTIVKK